VEPTATATAVQVVADNQHWLVKAFDQGGTAMIFIAIAGLITVALIIERFVALRSLIIDKEDFKNKLFAMILRGDLRQAIAFCDNIRAPLSSTVKAGLEQVLNKRPDEEVQVAMDSMVLKETPRLEGWTGMLAVLGNITTLIGLLGTIIGLIISFGGLATADPATKANMLATGISHALNCTAAGISVAIPALVFYGYFQIRIGRAISDMQETSMSLLNLVVANRDKMKG
jgi:biopolymer transport protein ExbB